VAAVQATLVNSRISKSLTGGGGSYLIPDLVAKSQVLIGARLRRPLSHTSVASGLDCWARLSVLSLIVPRPSLKVARLGASRSDKPESRKYRSKIN